MVAQHGLAWCELPHTGNDAAESLAALPWSPEIVVVDHYGLDSHWHDAVRSACGARITVIDDLANRPLAPDLLIDHNLAADHATKYRAVLADAKTKAAEVVICGGPRYALLDVVYAGRAPIACRQPVQCIGIFMGGSDPMNHSAWVLDLVRGAIGWTGELRIASTSSHPQLPALRELARAANAELWLDLPHLADFHAGCDLQIGAGGGALWERACLGVPTVALICADNQRQSVPLAMREGVLVGLDAMGQSPDQSASLVGAVRGLIGNFAQRLALRERSRALVDGQGAERVANKVMGLSPGDVSLRPATLADAELLRAWRNDEGTRAGSHQSGTVAAEEHRAWLERALADPQRRLWIACRGAQPIGTVRADRDRAADETTLSWTVAPGQRGRGLGRLMVQEAARVTSGPLHAEVKLGNDASACIARSVGLDLDCQAGQTLHFRRAG